MLKKFLIGTFVAAAFVVAFAATQASADCSITTTLKVGSKGAEVSCLQTKVGATSDGSFGPMTKASVMAYQSNHGLSADGVVGPLSRAVLNGAVSGNFSAGCTSASGFSSTTGLACSSLAANTFAPSGCTNASGFSPVTGGACYAVSAGLPAGCSAGAAFSSTTGASCGSAVAPINSTGEGSLAVSYDAIPADSTALLKGTNTAVLAYKLKATGSDMKVTRLYVNLTTGATISPRIWLAADSVTLLDGGTVIATLPLSASTVTEVTAGSEYQLQFNGLNVVVPVNTTKILTMKINRPTLTTSSTGTILIATTASSFRAVDGAGITDTYTTSVGRTLSFSASTAATGTMTNALSASSPVAQSISSLSSTSGVTTAVKLMDFNLKATDGPVNVTAITGNIATTGTCTSCVASVELRDGATVLSSVSGSSTLSAIALSFTSLNINVDANATKTLSVWGLINPVLSGYTTAGDSVTAAITATTGTSGDSYAAANTANTVTGNTLYLFQYAPTITLGAVSAVQVDESISASINKGANYSLAFTVTAPSGSDIYVDMPSTSTVIAYNATTVGTSKTNDTYGAALVTTTTVSGATSKGTTATTFDKVAAGTSRTFTIAGYVAHPATTVAGYVGMKLTGILWTATDSFSGAVDTAQTWGLSDFITPSIYTSRQ